MNELGDLDVLIIGAGPGGMQVAVTLEETRRRTGASFTYAVVERGEQPGTFFRQYPVHGRLISNNKLYTGAPPRSQFSERFDWNSLVTDDRAVLARDYSREFFPPREIVPQMLAAIRDRYDIPVHCGVSVEGVERRDGNFIVTTPDRRFAARFLVVATGLKPAEPAIPGLELTTPYSAMKPAEEYRDKRTLIIGKGNSGMECGQAIMNEASVVMIASPSPARLAFRTHYVGSIRLTNALLIENYQLKNQAALLDCEILSIRREGGEYLVDVAYKHADEERETLAFDEVIAATGFTGQFDAIERAFPIRRLHGKFPDIDGHFQSMDVPNLFFAGALTHGPDYRGHSSSGFIHGFRYNSVILARHLAEVLGAVAPPEIIAGDAFVARLFDDLENDAAMYLQPGYVGLCYERTAGGDWLAMGPRTCRWFDQTASRYRGTRLMTTLEYAPSISTFADPLSIVRHPGIADESIHIHPVIRLHDRGTVSRVNLEENLLNRYRHLPGAQAALAGIVARAGAAAVRTSTSAAPEAAVAGM